MNTRKRYRISVEDEGRLETLVSVSASPLVWGWSIAGVVIIIMFLGVFIAFLTPARRLLPGYLKESERAATQMQIMRIDSLRQVCETTAMFLDNLNAVMNPSGEVAPRREVSELNVPLSPDSLLPTSPEEARFVSMIRDREKYNISVVAPLAAESMLFSPVSESSVVTEATKGSRKAEIALAGNSRVAAIADGTVISVSQSLRDGGAVVIIQHPKGFLSRSGRLGQVLVDVGEEVVGGQVIALPNRGNARRGEIVTLEMWHNGNPLIPYEYIGAPTDGVPAPVIDEDVGRGHL